MSIAAHETREEKEKWLLRPLDWAMNVTIYSLACLVVPVLNKPELMTLYPDFIAYGALGALAVVFVLLFWAIKRITDAARGRG